MNNATARHMGAGRLAPLNLDSEIRGFEARRFEGRVRSVNGLLIEAAGPPQAFVLGGRAVISESGRSLRCEVVGFKGDRALLMPFDRVDGVRPGGVVRLQSEPAALRPTDAWLGRVIDCFGLPLDGGPALPQGVRRQLLNGAPPPAHARARLGERLQLGVRAIDSFCALRRGQRVGLFAGSGVGKSVLLSMLARGAAADVIVIGMIGERGREVREFIEDTLGADGLRRTVVVVATSDEPALRRRQAAYAALAVAEYFRDEGKAVLCLLDSVTRFAMAQREIGLAAGEPPATRGYPPTAFAELPKLLERAGPGLDGNAGSITGLFTVLVDGDDHNEPIADAARGILDGHIVLERAIAERGRLPAINVLKSISRTMPGVHGAEEQKLVKDARRLMAAYCDMEELIRIGAYRAGADPLVDEAIARRDSFEAFLSQDRSEMTAMPETFARLQEALS
ncbi:MAG: flagellar protein export ATPase FliI [Caulobacterales bacterium]